MNFNQIQRVQIIFQSKQQIFNGIRQKKKSEFNKFETYKIQLNKSKIK